MAWDGWFEYDGNEVINVQRTEAYARHKPWFKPVYGNDSLAPLLGERAYNSPLLDDAPWTDPDDLASYDFLGVYPLSVEGIESSTRTSTVVESAGEGGVAGRIRHATKPVTFNVALIASSDAGAEYGQRWLSRTLLSGPCGPGAGSSCFGGTLCYFAAEPVVEAEGTYPDGAVLAVLSGGSATADVNSPVLSGGGPLDTGGPVFSGGGPTDTTPVLTRSTSIFNVRRPRVTDALGCAEDLARSLRKVSFPSGPTVTRKVNLSDGGAVWTVSFTAVAGSPHQLGQELEVISGFLDPTVAVPWSGGVTPPGAAIDLDGYMMADESACSDPVVQPLYDPLHPAINLPPSVPSVPLGYFEPPRHWRRRQFTIPKQYVPLWGEMVPRLAVHARFDLVRNLRLRFYADPTGTGDTADDPCAFCGDIVISYIPEGYSLIFDGAEETVTAIAPGGIEQLAESLVFASNGTPFEWPRLTCGFGYVVTLDMPATSTPPVVDLSLFERIV